MSQKPFDPFRYNADTVPPLLRKDLARMAVPELSPVELEPPPGLKLRLDSLAGEGSPRVGRARRAKPDRGHSSSRWLAKASILLVVMAVAAVALVLWSR
jgi:hypothetical protein